MRLHHKIIGEGMPLVILHGLFGTADNWATLARQWADHFMVVLVDLRNHGRSPHHPEMNYAMMADDLLALMDDLWMHRVFLMGHSMGGKTAMRLALDHADRVERLMVIDIAPRQYSGGHEHILALLKAFPLREITTRQEAEAWMKDHLRDQDVIQFLLKNLTRNNEGHFTWKMNLEAIDANYPAIGAAIQSSEPYLSPATFIKGGRSDYILEDDMMDIKRLFPNSELLTVADAGHWVHADHPEEMDQIVRRFFKDE